MNRLAEATLLALQTAQVAFLLFHDWIPLGRLNDLPAVHAVIPRRELLRTTAISSASFVLTLAFSLRYATAPRYPGWLLRWLWISYGLLFLGELTAWWIPYLLRPDPTRAARYRTLFGRTHALLPQRNGITPNTLHVALHITTLATLCLLPLV